MIEFKQAKTTVERISYKPGWTFNLYDHCSSCGAAQLVIQFEAPDATGRDKLADIAIKAAYLIDLIQAPDASGLIRHILARVHSIEKHETLEWFKFDGVAVDDPHKEITGA